MFGVIRDMYLLPFGEKTTTLVCASETWTRGSNPVRPCRKLTTEYKQILSHTHAVPSCVCVHICGSPCLQTLVQNVPRCDVMCCDVPCCAVLCCVVFRRAVCALPRFVEHCCAVLCCAAPGCAVLCCAAPGCAVPCYAVLWRAVLCRAVPYCAVWCWRPGRTPRLVGPILGPLWLQSGPMQE